MPGSRQQALLSMLLGASLVAFVFGTRSSSAMLAGGAAGLGAGAIGILAWIANDRLIRGDGTGSRLGRGAEVNAAFMAVTYLWGGAMMLAGYGFSALVWRHWWQYGAGMILIGGVLALLSRGFARAKSSGRSDTIVELAYRATQTQLAAAVLGLLFLAGSGKLASAKPDWAANHVFLAGGLVIVALCIFAIRTHRRLRSETSPRIGARA